MEEYLTYIEYQEMGGLLSLTTFNLLNYKSKLEIDKQTFNRITKVTKAIKQLNYELINYYDEYKMNIASESANGYSVSYNVNIDIVNNLVNTYLSNEKDENGVALLYRGV